MSLGRNNCHYDIMDNGLTPRVRKLHHFHELSKLLRHLLGTEENLFNMNVIMDYPYLYSSQKSNFLFPGRV